MARYEATDSAGHKLWIIDIVDETSVRTRYGRSGTEPKENVATFATPAEAERAAERAIAAKVKAGYAVARRVPSELAPPGLSDLEAKIAADPDDLAACGVYGDWLQERSDPFGEVLALHVASGASEDPDRRDALRRDLEQARTSEAVLGPVAPHLDRLVLTWQGGVLREVRVRTGPEEQGVSAATLLGMLFMLPVARFVSRLGFAAFAFVDFGLAIEETLAGGGLRALRTLEVEPSYGTSRVKLRRLNALPLLRTAMLPFARLDATSLSLPALETLGLTNYFQPDTTARERNGRRDNLLTLAGAELPRVARLVLPIVSSHAELSALSALPDLHVVRFSGDIRNAEAVLRPMHAIRASLPRVDTFELDDVTPALLARLHEELPALHIVKRRSVDLD